MYSDAPEAGIVCILQVCWFQTPSPTYEALVRNGIMESQDYLLRTGTDAEDSLEDRDR